MFKSKITKEEVNQMPIVAFDGKIIIIDDVSKVVPAIEILRQSNFVGIDTETKPSFTRGLHHKVSLVQISTLESCFLFRLNKIPFPEELADFLADEKVKKIGLALRDDFNGLIKQKPFVPANFVDIQSIVHSYGILEMGLQKIFAIIFGRKISKSQRLTNWENEELTEQQQIYAATDAWASLLIYAQLQKEKKLTKKQVEKLLAEAAAEQASLNEARNAQSQDKTA